MEENIWEILDNGFKQNSGDTSAQTSYIVKQLQSFSETELLKMVVDFVLILQEGYCFNMMYAGQILNGHCADEELDKFLAFLLARGQNFWRNSLDNTDEFLARELNPGVYPMGFCSGNLLNSFGDAYYLKINVEPGVDEDVDVHFAETLHSEVWSKHSWFDKAVIPPVIDLEREYPSLYGKFWKDKYNNEKVYKMYGGMGDEGNIVIGEIWELFVDAPYAPFGLSRKNKKSYIPPISIVNDFFISGGGGDGGMSPGSGWNPFRITKSQYDLMVDKLLSINTKEEKKKHFFLPLDISIDRELNAKYPNKEEWREQFKIRY